MDTSEPAVGRHNGAATSGGEDLALTPAGSGAPSLASNASPATLASPLATRIPSRPDLAAAAARSGPGNGTPAGGPGTNRPARRPPAEAMRRRPQLAPRAIEAPVPTEVIVHRTRRVIRRINVWSVGRISLLLYATVLVTFMVALVALWTAAAATGAVTSVEHFIASTLLLKSFHFRSLRMLLAIVAVGVIGVVMGTLGNMLGAVFYNLASDVVGGVELIVIEEEPVPPVV